MTSESKLDKHERDVAIDLLKDFAANPAITPEVVYRLSWERFNIMEGAIEDFPNLLREYKNQDKERYLFGLNSLPRLLHGYMYRNLYTFAGSYRDTNDPGGGVIYFGKTKGNKKQPEFHGASPDSIYDEVFTALSNLVELKPIDPLHNSMKFYQQFVFTHPFYDGNGRLARLIANIYLFDFSLTINWSEFDSKAGFVKKLNWCHKAGSPEAFEQLVNYVRKYTIELDTIDTDNSTSTV